MFTQHRNPERAWPVYLDAYTLMNVVEARPMSESDRRLRTLVYRAQLKDKGPEYAIKVVPAYDIPQSGIAISEMRVHYFLSQMDAEAVRFAEQTADNALFKVSSENRLEHDEQVNQAIVEGKSWNVVPLYDFAARKAVIKTQPDFETKMADVTLPSQDDWAGFLTMKYFDETVVQHVRKLALNLQVTMLRDVMAQLCAVLHQLMAIDFTHNDLKLDNVAFIPIDGGDATLYHRLAPDILVVLKNQTGYFAMFDFGFAVLNTQDASSSRWVAKAVAKFRFPGDSHLINKNQLFAPVLDLYRVTESICGLLHVAIINTEDEKELDNIKIAETTQQLKRMLLAVLNGLPSTFKEETMIKAMTAFAQHLGDDEVKKKAQQLKAEWDTNTWTKLHKGLPPTRDDIMKLALPWDVLGPEISSDIVWQTTDAPAGATEMTMKPLLGPGRRYTGATFTKTFRTAPLQRK